MDTTHWRNNVYLTILVCLKFGDRSVALDPPAYEWPLGDSSVLAEVFRGKDMEAEGNKKCFAFPNGYPDLPYKAIRVGGNSVSFVQAQLSPDSRFEDMTISLLVYPEDASSETSTLLHYIRGEGDKNMKEKIRIRIMDIDFIITFRDQFDIPAGLVLIDNPLQPFRWNHLVIVREFRTGQISVFCNGESVYQGEDDEFPNDIPLEEDGLLMIGKAYIEEGNPETEEEQFTGRISCLQIFQYAIKEEELSKILDFCEPDSWSYPPSVNLIPDESGGDDVYCLSEDILTTTLPPFVADTITLRELTNENVWKTVKQRYGWHNSNRDTSYFKLVSRDNTPPSDVSGIGSVNTTNLSVCSRLCMRIDGCKSFSIIDAKGKKRCEMYDFVINNLVNKKGSSYYAIRN